MADPLFDGNTDFLRGQDASKNAEQVDPNGYFAAINATGQNGSLDPRFQFVRKTLRFPNDKGYTNRARYVKPFLEIFKAGRYQAKIPYSVGNRLFNLYVVNGLIYALDIKTFEFQMIDLPGPPIWQGHPRVYWESAGRYLVIHDYPSYPVIIEGLTARRSDPKKNEIPITVMGAYNQNRLAVANAGDDFIASDPAGAQAFPDAPITFNEYFAPSTGFTGQYFTLPTASRPSPITAMTFLPVRDTSTGIGPLIVGTKYAIYSFQTAQPRANWLNGQFGSVLLFNNGIAGQRAHTVVNGDLFFVSIDGQLRSLSMSRDEQGKWSNRPLSREVRNYLKFWDKELVAFTAVTYFANKLFVTANPYRVTATGLNGEVLNDVAFGGLVSLSLDNMAEISEANPPAWDGLWTGMRPMDFIVNGDRCFAISKEGNENVVWEVVPKLSGYDLWDGKRRVNKTTLYTREYTFDSEQGGGEFTLKEALSLEPQLENIQGKFKLDVEFKPAQMATYVPWGHLTHVAPYELCSFPSDAELNGLESHGLLNPQLGSPSANVCDDVNKIKPTFFKKLQIKLMLSGDNWSMHGIKVGATMRPQNSLVKTCAMSEGVKVIKQCDTDWIYEEFSTCL